MKLKSKLLTIARLVADEAERNAPFRKSLEAVFEPPKKRLKKEATQALSKHRRAKAKIDPVQMTREKINVRGALRGLDLEELKDVVAEFGMDPSKLVMKWKDADRIIDHIIETSNVRASKGSAFKR